MMLAAHNGRGQCVKALVKAGADVHATSLSGQTALSLAGSNGYLDIGLTLLKAGAKVDKKTWKWSRVSKRKAPKKKKRQVLALPAPQASSMDSAHPVVRQAWG